MKVQFLSLKSRWFWHYGILRFTLCLGVLCVALTLFFSAASPRAQETQSVATFYTETRLVNVYASVRDKKGAVVQNLTKDDFTIEEDGRSQKIGFFSRENDLPLFLGLLVDTSPSEARMIDEEREASHSFLVQVMDPKKDQTFLVHFDTQVELLQDLTNSLSKLEKALDSLKDVENGPTMARRGQDLQDGGGRSPDAQGGQDGSRGGPPDRGMGTTHLFDAVYLASNEVMKSQTGRKALIVIGDGDDLGSTYTRDQAIRAAQQADLIVYCIRIEDRDFGKQSGRNIPLSLPGLGIPRLGGPGLGGPGGGGPGGPGGGGQGPGGGGPDRSEGKRNMEVLSTQTGGSLYEVSKKLPLTDVFAQIQTELRNLYSLGYTPDANARSGYRHIKVTVNRKGAKVQAREGYYADRD